MIKRAMLLSLSLLSLIILQWHTHTAERDVVCLWKYQYAFVVSNQEKVQQLKKPQSKKALPLKKEETDEKE